MTLERWTAVDRYLSDLLLPPDRILDAVLAKSASSGLPPQNVAPNQGKLLYLLARLANARAILEIGTLGGYSTIWLARALSPNGHLITLEANPEHARVARANISAAGLGDVIEVREGPAIDSLAALASQGSGPFDLIFIDADKPNNPEYLKWALRLSRPGTLILADNVVRSGYVIEPDSTDASVQGVRHFLEMVASEPRLSATAIQTVGSKGYDGFALAIVER